MFDSSQFDKILKTAEKLNKILEKTQGIRVLRGIDASISQMKHATKEADKLRIRQQKLYDMMDKYAARKAGLSQAEIRDHQRIIRSYDREADLIKRQLKLVRDRKSELYKARRPSMDEYGSISTIKNKLQTAKSNYEQLSASYEADRRMYKFDALKEVEIEQTKDLIARLSEELVSRKSLQNEIKINTEKEKELVSSLNALREQQELEANMPKSLKDKFLNLLPDGPIKALASSALNLSKSVLAFSLVAFILKSLLGAYRDALQASVDIGLDASQRTTQILRAQNIAIDAMREHGALITPKEALLAEAALSDRLATLDVQRDLVMQSALLTRQIGLSSEHAATLLDFFYRLRKETAEASKYSAILVRATALSNNTNPRQIMQDIATNADNFAKSGRASADEMARAAIYVRRLGTDLSTVAGIADRIVSDFEGTLEAQATIGAFAPGFDMTGLLVASQFGTDEDIARELQASVKSMGLEFDTLPRSFKLAISSSLGMSVEELGRIMQSDDINLITPDAEHIAKAQKGSTNELQQAILHPLDSIARGVSTIVMLLARIVPGVGAKELAQSMTNEQLQEYSMKSGVLSISLANASRKELQIRSLQQTLANLDNITPRDSAQATRIDKIRKQRQTELDDLLNPKQRSYSTGGPLNNPTYGIKPESRATGGVVGVDRAPLSAASSLMSILGRLKSNEVPTILHKGEGVLNQAQMGILRQLTSVQSAFGSALSGFLGSFRNMISGSGGLISKLGGLFMGGGSGGGILGKLGSLFGGGGSSGGGGILGKIGGLFGGGSGGILGKIGGLFGGGSGGILGKIGGLFGGGGLGSIFKGGLGNILGGLGGGPLGLLAGPLLSKIPGINSITGGIGKIGGGIIKGIGSIFGGGARSKKIDDLKRRVAAAKLSMSPTNISSVSASSGLLGLGASASTSSYRSGITIPSVPGSSVPSAQSSNAMTSNSQGVEQRLDSLISLLRNGGIAVNMDGRKVSSGLVTANRYG